MNERKRILFLILILAIVSLAIAGITNYILYEAAFAQNRERLIETAQSQVRLIEAVARFDAVHSKEDHPAGWEAATLSQFMDAHKRYKGFARTGEFTLARRKGEHIVFLLIQRHFDFDHPESIPFHSALAEPMRRALSGKSGSIVGLDYRGAKVLAAHEPVRELNLGIVAKIDLKEIRAPFVKAALIAGSFAVLFIICGAMLFLRISNPMIRSLVTSEEKYRSLITNMPDVVWRSNSEGKTTFISPRAEDVYGYLPEDIYREGEKLWFGRIHPDDIDTVKKAYETLFAENKKFDVEYRIRKKDGKWIWLHDKAIVTSEKGGTKYADGLFADITELKQTKEELKQHRDHLRELVEERTAKLKSAHEKLTQEFAERKIAEEQLKQNYEIQNVINSLLGLSLKDVSLDELFDHSLELIFSIPSFAFEAKASIFLVEDEPEVLVMKSQKGLSEPLKNTCGRVPFGKCICGCAAFTGEVQFTAHFDERHEIQYEGMTPHGHYCLPIKSDSRILGALCVYVREGHRRDDKEEDFLTAVTNTLAGIIIRRRSEQELRESEARLAEAQRIAHLGNWDWDIVHNNLYWSDEIYRIFGLKPQAFAATYEAFLNAVHPDDREMVQKSVDDAFNEKKPYRIDHRFIHPDGTQRFVHEQATVIFDETGKPFRMVGTVQDVSERKSIEEELRIHRNHLEDIVKERVSELGAANEALRREIGIREQTEKTLRESARLNDLLLDSLPHPALLVSRDRIVLAANRMARETGTEVGEFCWRSFGQSQSIPDEHKSYIKEHDGNVPPGGSQCVHCMADEMAVTNESKNNPEVNALGRLWDTWWIPVGDEVYLHYAINVTDRKREEQELRESKDAAITANRAKSEFLANMSHELRTPLNAIIGFSEVLGDQYFGQLNEKQAEYVTDIYGSGKHLLSLINDILDLSKIEAGKMALELSQVNIENLLQDSLIMIKEKAHKHGIRLDLRISEELSDLEIQADERKLKQIMFNLLSNAAKFTPDHGSIHVSARIGDLKEEDTRPQSTVNNQQSTIEGQSTIEISVADSGIGIAPEDQKKIFDEFYQVKGGIVNKTAGTGLGLPLTRHLVEMHGGKIRVESDGEGKGSRFSFMLPVRRSDKV